ncbi:hypothetical protein N7495_008002 [Penicillium taxi]|uniref:uncharacterized protein n=1 Tax=Penicillium taxi TaxID=168475 RepID=UPI0025452B41|nr:uncharacterized protein N7495_008002 [Penicillium taxi]KAJ5887961.1 hypothetical protein N7495_008002 [Penicillium taxi]
MFRNRNNAQKPDDDFISRFQQTFSDVVPRRDSDGSQEGDPMMSGRYKNSTPGFWGFQTDTPNHGNRPMSNDQKMQEEASVKFSNQRTPRNLQDLNFSPSWIDHNPMHMMSIANQPTGFYTPNSTGLGTIFHNQAGDLHTPTMGLNMMTPLSLSNTIQGPQHHEMDHHFNHQYLSQQMPDMNSYIQQPASFAPSAFMHRDSYDPMDESGDGLSVDGNGIPMDQVSNVTTSDYSNPSTAVTYSVGENFRYNVTLRAPTAMVKSKKEIPISYLNKGQAYNLTVLDSTPPNTSEQLRYRTFVRVSFEDEEQRSRPAACWQLWKEGRGTSEAHQRGGKLLAVEYVDPLQSNGDDHKNRQIQIEQMSFDGFCITWTASPTGGVSDCTIPVRFNFLSTDFSHSKGVKGIPVRLCAKTELLSSIDSGASRQHEVCYCKVKLFRDHGAERKLSNDVAHVKKSIDKLKQQIAQAEMGGGFGKRKRGNNVTGVKSEKSIKHKRTWSVSSQEALSDKMSVEDDLQAKLVMMQDMFSSTRSMSSLALRGDPQDDPDMYPIQLPTEGEFVKVEPLRRQSTGLSSASLIPSPTSSHVSLNNSPHMHAGHFGMREKQSTVIPRENISTGYIEAVDIDPTYRPPAERPPKPIACFYVRFSGNEQHPQEYYRAIYLTERTVRDLMTKISEKHQINPDRIVRILHVNQAGLRIMVDDDVVRELPEGQDMIVDIQESPLMSSSNVPGSPVEIKLTY